MNAPRLLSVATGPALAVGGAAVAHDRGGDVTNFKRSNKIYRVAMKHNSDLDLDRDKIACEKA